MFQSDTFREAAQCDVVASVLPETNLINVQVTAENPRESFLSLKNVLENHADLTDELFGIAIGRPGYLNPYYSYGAFLVALPGWSIGTAAGVIAGNLLPGDMVKALSVSLFGMFLAIIIPPARKDKVVLVLIIISFAASYLCSRLTVIRDISSGTRTIILTLIIAGIAAWRFPPQTEITPENADAQKEQGADV